MHVESFHSTRLLFWTAVLSATRMPRPSFQETRIRTVFVTNFKFVLHIEDSQIKFLAFLLSFRQRLCSTEQPPGNFFDVFFCLCLTYAALFCTYIMKFNNLSLFLVQAIRQSQSCQLTCKCTNKKANHLEKLLNQRVSAIELNLSG